MKSGEWDGLIKRLEGNPFRQSFRIGPYRRQFVSCRNELIQGKRCIAGRNSAGWFASLCRECILDSVDEELFERTAVWPITQFVGAQQVRGLAALDRRMDFRCGHFQVQSDLGEGGPLRLMSACQLNGYNNVLWFQRHRGIIFAIRESRIANIARLSRRGG